MKKYNLTERVIEFESGEKFTFDFPIAETIEFETNLVVRLKIPPKINYNQNIFCIDFNGRILWQIEESKHPCGDSPYVYIYKDNNNVKLINWDGTNLIVNPKNGQILKRDFSK